MLILLTADCSATEAEGVLRAALDLGLAARHARWGDRRAVAVDGARGDELSSAFNSLRGVARVLPVDRQHRHVLRPPGGATRVIRVGSTAIGAGELTVIAGPCAVESEEQLLPLARALRDAGVDLLRGGAYKPRSSPYDFQGLGLDGLRLLARARTETGLPVITEALDERSLDQVEEYADVVQIGARNMQNYALLKRAARSPRPVFLKRGLAASLEDLLLAAEYVIDGGNPDVMLCERGIRTFSDHSRFTLDLSIVPLLKRHSGLPVFVDPSHASGIRESVAPLARAAVAVGADGVMIEVHPEPERALCDGAQSLTPGEFRALVGDLRRLAPLVTDRGETVT